MWIAKISGVTNLDAAISVDVSSEFAIGTIIDDIGEIRSVSKFDARRIFATVEFCITIAEIVPTSINEIFETQDICQPNMIQINGEFFDNEDNLIAVQSIATIPIIGSITIDKEPFESNILDPDPVKAVKILDRYVHVVNVNLPIGSSWNSVKKRKQIEELVDKIKDNITKPLIVGGGLTSANVGEIAKILTPNAVDISSGVEKISGIKNPELMQEFLETVYNYKEFIQGI
ncbi:MAG: hypothetical protein KAS63_03065 [Candidatus Heimdallarchaeota archaeon]|nr:hypothetical protein [Candidatus Heimdallarchaeota archaeon]MCK4954317.1 hypothetical protein [Candidatus Heimdallarchaeota archaeon]